MQWKVLALNGIFGAPVLKVCIAAILMMCLSKFWRYTVINNVINLDVSLMQTSQSHNKLLQEI